VTEHAKDCGRVHCTIVDRNKVSEVLYQSIYHVSRKKFLADVTADDMLLTTQS
jgi:hypothetical protein